MMEFFKASHCSHKGSLGDVKVDAVKGYIGKGKSDQRKELSLSLYVSKGVYRYIDIPLASSQTRMHPKLQELYDHCVSLGNNDRGYPKTVDFLVKNAGQCKHVPKSDKYSTLWVPGPDYGGVDVLWGDAAKAEIDSQFSGSKAGGKRTWNKGGASQKDEVSIIVQAVLKSTIESSGAYAAALTTKGVPDVDIVERVKEYVSSLSAHSLGLYSSMYATMKTDKPAGGGTDSPAEDEPEFGSDGGGEQKTAPPDELPF